MGNTLKRYNSIRRADDLNDQLDSDEIATASQSQTQEQLQTLLLSRLRQIIFGEDAPEHWFDDLAGSLSLRELTARLSGNEASPVRLGVPLVGILDGVNREFRTQEKFLHGVNGRTIEVWHNGRLLQQASSADPRLGDYTVAESQGAGTGFDTIKLLSFAPVGTSILLANYTL